VSICTLTSVAPTHNTRGTTQGLIPNPSYRMAVQSTTTSTTRGMPLRSHCAVHGLHIFLLLTPPPPPSYRMAVKSTTTRGMPLHCIPRFTPFFVSIHRNKETTPANKHWHWRTLKQYSTPTQVTRLPHRDRGACYRQSVCKARPEARYAPLAACAAPIVEGV